MYTKQYVFLRKYTKIDTLNKLKQLSRSKEEKKGVGHGDKKKLSIK